MSDTANKAARIFAGVGLALTLAGCGAERPVEPTNTTRIVVWHDDQRNVTCWILMDRSIACLPDQYLKEVQE